VSDFYTAYDSIECPQQKCLIHLMRDLNDEILNTPFDEELKTIVAAFAALLKPMVETIDRRGLKKRFLTKHLIQVEWFYRYLAKSDFQSETALKCKQRFEKNRDKLFTFLRYSGVPWNNINAEHAIRRLQGDVIAGTSTKKGVDEYLTLLPFARRANTRGWTFSTSCVRARETLWLLLTRSAEDREAKAIWLWGNRLKAEEKVPGVFSPIHRHLRDSYLRGRFFTKFQNPRGSVIVKPLTSPATSSKSLSPVTSTSALAANATASTHLSSSSRTGIEGGDIGLG
jgi:hypothetical protein